MTILEEFEAGNIIEKTQTFTVTSGSTILPMSGSIIGSAAFLLNQVVATTNLRLRLYGTPLILDGTDPNIVSEQEREFGSVTGSISGSPVQSDLILDVDADTPGIQRLNPPIFGAHASTGTDEIYYYLTEASSQLGGVAANTLATTSLSGTITITYIQLATNVDAPSPQTVTITAGTAGTSGSFNTPEVYAIFSASLAPGGLDHFGNWDFTTGSRLRIYQDEESMNAPGEIDRVYDTSITSSYQFISGSSNISTFFGNGLIADILFAGDVAGPLFPVEIGANMRTVPVAQSWYRYETTASLGEPASITFSLKTVEFK